jgi:hypothetical protein
MNRRPAGHVLLLALVLAWPAAGPVQAEAPARPTAAEEATAREKELLERIQQMKTPQWRSFGACRYSWTTWRLSDKGVRTTSFECGSPPVTGSVGVYCPSLKISRRVADGDWEPWRLPLSMQESSTQGGEDAMVASLCANVKPAPAASSSPPSAGGATPVKPAKTTTPAKPTPSGKPASTNPAKPVPSPPAQQKSN